MLGSIITMTYLPLGQPFMVLPDVLSLECLATNCPGPLTSLFMIIIQSSDYGTVMYIASPHQDKMV